MTSPIDIDRYAVAGNPVAHSQSPAIHAQFAAQTGQVLTYERLLCPLDGFADSIRAFAASGGRGCNVTVPFKFEAHALATRLSERAKLAGAVNTLRFDAVCHQVDDIRRPPPEELKKARGGPSLSCEGWFGDNTDGAGLVRDIEVNAQRPLAGRRVLLLGAGGASAGALGSLIAARPASICIANRSVDKAETLIATHQAYALEHGVTLSATRLDDCGEGYDFLINATSASLGGAGVPVAASVLAPGALALDMMYGPAAAPFLNWAREHGAEPRDGLGMLVEQAGEAFALWRGVRPDTAAVLNAMRVKLSAAQA
ncbi:shikimate dehydrogenase [Roseateles oligotrophus]|uniref:Shikimate dehydrogenase (NADP(+)) n=1 Tax=Roseateles oligotrophus TaxID=1769250 RepID=A0ABT2YJ20_9BURK|nr:shikimate dehydrogenase [Roseateles oligotrophus]MCV2370049.1 shikimate dehydrogenase [Roseateles oligotrophus]